MAQEKRRLLDPEISYMPVALSDGDSPTYKRRRGGLQVLVEAPAFQSLIGLIILSNALVIGLETDEITHDCQCLQDIFLCLFALEILLRLCAYGFSGFFSTESS
ncbi:unnamed protein product, partial [Effrenium voratum]